MNASLFMDKRQFVGNKLWSYFILCVQKYHTISSQMLNSKVWSLETSLVTALTLSMIKFDFGKLDFDKFDCDKLYLT